MHLPQQNDFISCKALAVVEKSHAPNGTMVQFECDYPLLHADLEIGHMATLYIFIYIYIYIYMNEVSG